MRLHENKTLFRQAVRAAADFKGVSEVYIEKDYWVTLALKTIFTHPDCGDAIFKGGTALSKCFNIIERFSEDIDLVVIRHEGDSKGQMTRKIRNITRVVSEVIPEVQIDGFTKRMSQNRKTAHAYSREFNGDFGQVRDMVIVEASWLGSSEPNVQHNISSYIYEMMMDRGQKVTAEEHGLMPFEVRVLAIQRTMCEKIMSLVRFSYDENPIQSLQNKIRHCYDLHLLLQREEVNNFFESQDFDELLNTVAKDDVTIFKQNYEWLKNHPANALLFLELQEVWSEIRSIYQQDFSALVYGDLPDESLILESLMRIRDRLHELDWDLEIEDGS